MFCLLLLSSRCSYSHKNPTTVRRGRYTYTNATYHSVEELTFLRAQPGFSDLSALPLSEVYLGKTQRRPFVSVQSQTSQLFSAGSRAGSISVALLTGAPTMVSVCFNSNAFNTVYLKWGGNKISSSTKITGTWDHPKKLNGET